MHRNIDFPGRTPFRIVPADTEAVEKKIPHCLIRDTLDMAHLVPYFPGVGIFIKVVRYLFRYGIA